MKALVRLIWISIFLLIGVNNIVYAFDDIELVGQLPGGSQRFFTVRVTIVGNYAYIATGEDLRIVDVSIPSAPAEVGFYQIPAIDATVVGSYAYIVGDGLHVFDVSTPSSPSEVGVYQVFGVDVAVVGNYAYVGGWSDLLGMCLFVVDISTPSAPAEVGFFQIPVEEITSVTAVGSYAYTTEGPKKGGLRIIDVSTPSVPAEVGFYQSPVGWGFGVNVVDSYAYFIVGTLGMRNGMKDGLSIVDVSTPSSPSEVGFCEIHDDAYWNGANITVVGGYAYIAGGKGLRIFDISMPSSPYEVGFYQTPAEATGVSVKDDLIYVADDEGGMSILRRITLSAGAVLSGKITAPDGKPVADVYISPRSSVPEQSKKGWISARTSADGAYSFTLASGTYTLVIVPPEGSGLLGETISDVHVEEDMTLDIKLETIPILSGRVTDSDGKPVANASINVSGPSYVSTKTAADGTYRMILAPGVYRLEIDPPTESNLRRKNISDVQVTKDTTLDITLESPIILSGKITAPDGNPVANVSISLRGESWIEPVRSAADGTYRIIILTPGAYKLYFEPPEGSGLPIQEGPEVQATQSATLDITLEAGVILSGKVTAPDGKPIANVSINANGRMQGHRGSAKTANDGTYNLPLLPDAYRLEIFPPEGSDFPSQKAIEVQVTEDTTLDITLTAGIILSGKVTTPDGKPLANANMSVSGETGSWSTQTTADGAYRFVLLPGAYTLYIEPPWDSGLPRNVIKDVQVKEDMTFDITLKVTFLSGKVTDANGKPVANASIRVSEGLAGGQTQTANDGVYRLGLIPGIYRLTIEPPQGSGLPGKSIRVQVTGDMTLDITLEIITTFALSGRVTNAEGKPVANVSITAGGVSGVTSADGTYRMTIMSGTHQLYITPPKGSGLPLQTISGVEITEDTRLDITLQAGAILSGKVTDADGKPVENAHISASWYGYARTAADGTYRLSLSPGSYYLNVEPPYGSELPRRTIRGVKVKEDMTLDITLKWAILSGRVSDPEGKPVADVQILRDRTLLAQTSPDGIYSIKLAPDTSYTLKIQPPEESGLFPQILRTIEVEEERRMDITMERALVLAGRVTDSMEKPVANVYIWVPEIQLEYEQFYGGSTSADGTYRITLAPGIYTLLLLPRGEERILQTISNVKVTEDTTLDITLVPNVILSGLVLSPDGKPVAGVGMKTINYLKKQWVREGYTSANGAYRIALPPGNYILKISPPWNESLQRNEFLHQTIADVEITKDTTLDITLERGMTLSGRITYPDGKPGADVSISPSALDAPPGYVEEHVERVFYDGSYTIAPLHPGAYRLEINPPWGSKFPRQTITDVKVTKDTTLDITLKEGVVLSGRVTAPEGKPAAGVSVSASEMATRSGYGAGTSYDGAYRIRLMPGTYTLHFNPPQDSEFLSQTISDVQVKGDTTLDITLKVGKRFTISGRVTNSKGKGIANISVSAYNRSDRTDGYTMTAGDGSYQVTLIEGKYDMTYGVKIDDYDASIDVFSGRRIPNVEVNNDVTLDITLPPLYETFEVQGRILDKEGRGMRDVYLRDVYLSAYEETTGNFSRCDCRNEGFYRLLLPAGTYSLTLTSSDYQIPQFPEQRIENFVVEGNTVKNIIMGELVPASVEPESKQTTSWGKIKQNALLQNYPNPFNPETWIPYLLAQSAEVTIQIYSVTGQLVRTLKIGRRDPGEYVSKAKAAHWDGRNDVGERVASGVYFYIIQADNFTATRKLAVSK